MTARRAEDHALAVLTIDLAAIVDNWRQLRSRVAPAACAAVVKADAYGLGAAVVAPALARDGCKTFFVATVGEAEELHAALAPITASARICVLAGVPVGAEDEVAAAGFFPVLNSIEDCARWSQQARRLGRRLPALLHVDTGMSRLGLPPEELNRLTQRPELLEGVTLALVMSHLACAEQPDHPLNERQRLALADARARLLPALGSLPASLAASSGIILGAAYHFDLVRPGAALYGVAPRPGDLNPMRAVVALSASILQVREIDSGTTVGYGATHVAAGRRRIATVGVGYADGWLRSLSNRAFGTLAAFRVPLVGRVSMDLSTFDVTGVPAALAHPGAAIELIGPTRPVDAVAEDAGTIGYEILTSLGRRYARHYRSCSV